MRFTSDEKHEAMAAAYKVLVGALAEVGALDPDIFVRMAGQAIKQQNASGQAGAASALAELLEPVVASLDQPRRPL